MKDYFKLDNPAWYALTETHSVFARGNEEVKRYRPDIVAFAAVRDATTAKLNLPDDLVSEGESFFIIGNLPTPPEGYSIESVLPCLQMICPDPIPVSGADEIIALGNKDDEEIVTLINQVQPGYYKPGTRQMGDYFGIRQQGRLVAISGERMRMNGLTEISAVVTHPEYSGRGYARQLVTHVVNKNFANGIIPFLHVAQTNERAIGLYASMGFKERRIIDFTKIKRFF